MKLRLQALLLCALALTGCPAHEIKPVAIVLDEDGCSVCYMAVSQLKFAAETVTADGQVDYYDDIGCLVQRTQAGQLPADSRSFVVDHNTGEWLDASAATYLRSASLPTPMSYGLAALNTGEAATALSRQYSGSVLTWQQLLAEFKP